MREGLLARFDDEHALARAIVHLRGLGYRELDAFMPFSSHEVLEALALPRSRLPLFVLLGAITGGSLAYLVLFYTNVIDYPLNVGGRPLHPWPAFVPITFESTILGAGLAAFFGFFALARLPRLWTPIAELSSFRRATSDGFFLAVSASDPRFDRSRTWRDLAELFPAALARFGDTGEASS